MLSPSRHIGFDDRIFTLIGIPVTGLLIPVVFGGLYFDQGPAYWIAALISTGYTAVYWLSARFLMIQLHRRYPGAEQLSTRVRWMAALFLPFILLTCTISFYTVPASPQESQNFLQSVLMSSLLTLTIAGIYESVYLLHHYRQVQIEREQLMREKMQTELEALRNQVNPHFLFNSLNALADLISEDPRRAEQYVQELSKVYRYVLEIQSHELITLREELDFLQSYLYLQQTRFGDKLRVHFALPPHFSSRRIVPLALQLLVENAIKHNVVSAARPLTIEFFAGEGDALHVRNNLQLRQGGAAYAEASTRKGLSNLKARYRLLGAPAVLEQMDQDYFSVRMPTLDAEMRDTQHTLKSVQHDIA